MYQTIAELSAFSSAAQSLLSEDERRELISYLAQEPKAGVLIQGTGGVRKLRWAKGNRGKSAGVRVIYYFYDERIPLYLLTVFGKNDRANLSQAERNGLKNLVDQLVSVAFGE
ncbi:MAG: type II toxin-antitoxin system RelE/ParE family toxin [Ferrovum myxofaciens]|uniref:type II toxin-antitoxin system RelE/ParE family toxin n=1 Tax=Ferrovum myxofaciens TaxID=416213 RepID=UPI002354CE62|nr:type II toxin-antitoxin system RelE/ParE family toxin [Ferrovum myxofaciens]QKE40707.1 MAG: type II toxin-antitoxin system RelE/ParE family toxin [Ferrovum myxofaciens]